MKHEPARTIIEKIGGPRVVAQIIGKDVTRVYRWMYPKERGGTGGDVPMKDARRLLEFARANDVSLSPNDFLAPSQCEVAA